MKNFKLRLLDAEPGRFDDIIHALDVKDFCEDCFFWDSSLGPRHAYRCACMPKCIGETLSESMKSYLKWKLGNITEEQHHSNLGIPYKPPN